MISQNIYERGILEKLDRVLELAIEAERMGDTSRSTFLLELAADYERELMGCRLVNDIYFLANRIKNEGF